MVTHFRKGRINKEKEEKNSWIEERGDLISTPPPTVIIMETFPAILILSMHRYILNVYVDTAANSL